MQDQLSKVELINKSNSMFLHPIPNIDTRFLKQIGDFTLGPELGSGAFGKVVIGKHILTDEHVAIKILDKLALNQTPTDYESVKNEISILKLVKHKHIAQLYEVLETPQHIFIIMEYCEGKDILDYILTKTKLSEEESLKFFRQLINALFYLHSQNIAHRDIKIDNLLLDRNQNLKLIDFGLSTKYPDDDLLSQACGTLIYAAPELLQGKEYHGMLADVWSSGIVLYGMLSGYLPFGDKNDEINKQKIIKGEIKYPNFFSPEVKDLLMHMLDLNPMTRYTLQEIRNHPWFKAEEYKLIPGIIIGTNLIPVDEKIVNLCVTYNFDKNKVIESVKENKFNSETSLYYLLIKKLIRKGYVSISDFSSDEFIDFVLDDNNVVEKELSNKKEPDYLEHSGIKNIKIPGMALDLLDISEDKENIPPNGVLSNLINKPSFRDNLKNSYNNERVSTHRGKNELETKRSNKNTSSSSKIKNQQIIESLKVKSIKDFKIHDDNKIMEENCNNEENILKFMDKKYYVETPGNKFSDKETPRNENVNIKNNKSDKEVSEKKVNTLSKQKKYIDRKGNTTLKKNMENDKNNEIDAQKFKDFRKINLFKQELSSINSNSKKNISKEEITKGIIVTEQHIENKENNKYLDSDLKNLVINNEDININLNISDIINNEKNENEKYKENQKNLEKKGNKENEEGKKTIENTVTEKNKKKINKIDHAEHVNIIVEHYQNLKTDNHSKVTKTENSENEKKSKKLNKNKTNPTINILVKSTKIIHINISKPNISTNKMKKGKNTSKEKSVHSTIKNNNMCSYKNKYNKFITTCKKAPKKTSKSTYKKSTGLPRKILNKKNFIFKNTLNSDFILKRNKNQLISTTIKNNSFMPKFVSTNQKTYTKSKYLCNSKLKKTNLHSKFEELIRKSAFDNCYAKKIVKSPLWINLNEYSLSRSNSKPKSKSKSKPKPSPQIKNNYVPLKNILFSSIINKINYNANNKNNNKHFRSNLECSVSINRFNKSPIGIRELSESNKNKLMNEKTRKAKIPWKIKKKGIDEKLSVYSIYEKYINKYKNPFKTGKGKIFGVANKKYKKNILTKTETKNNNSNNNNLKEINYTYKKKPIINFSNNNKIGSTFISQNKFKSGIYNDLIDQKCIYPKKLFEQRNNIFLSNSTSSTSISNFILDLSCIFSKAKSLNECYLELYKKLKKKNITFCKKKNGILTCNKNGFSCDIKIIKMNEGENAKRKEKEIYYYKIFKRQGTYGIRKYFRNLILSP